MRTRGKTSAGRGGIKPPLDEQTLRKALSLQKFLETFSLLTAISSGFLFSRPV